MGTAHKANQFLDSLKGGCLPQAGWRGNKMITAIDLTKKFGDFTALDKVSCHIEEGSIYGMVGSNGAGKSTFLRVLAGVYKRNGGEISIDGEDVWENTEVKSRMVFVPDELYFLPGADIRRMGRLYKSVYKTFDDERFNMLLETFKLPPKKPIEMFSKGMKRQAAAILALSVRPEYLLFDETFDGLDPVMRKFVKSLICSDVAERKVTAIVTSHSLRELEDICDQLVLLHKGGVVLENNVSNLKTSLFKVQIAFSGAYDRSMFDDIGGIAEFEKNGSVANMIIRGDMQAASAKLKAKKPLLLDILPLSLEEVFIHEMERLGYSFDDVQDIT